MVEQDQQSSNGTISLVVKAVIVETADTKSFVLSSRDKHHQVPDYKAGQFLTFIFTRSNGEEVRRNYSISSSPVLDEPLTITVKRIANGEFSRYLCDIVQEGDELKVLGAAGFFLLPASTQFINQLFFFAAGSGITPVISLIKTALFENPEQRLVLLYSNKKKATTIFYDKLIALQDQYPGRLIIEFIFSTTVNLLTARLNAHFLGTIIASHQQFPDEQVLFYVCGPLDYMRLVTIFLQTSGVPATHIRKEIFHIEQPTKRPQPPDQDEHKVTLHYHNSTYNFTAKYPTTILQAAKQQGIKLPYSCESGQCGTCVARCTSGKVWMYNNEVLTDDELGKGLVLTCTGFPIAGHVSLHV
ncbi:MAG: ferredoxin--NADP reductase [Ferruginibacter sp.]|nr:ferredoxin--NADP reductase [Ferruginibacter sp.]